MAHATTVIPTGLAALLRHHAHALADVLPRAREGHVRSVHRARVASRRLREALPVAAGNAARLEMVRRELRRVTTSLGEVREMDVALQTFERETVAHGWSRMVVRRVRTHLERERVRRDERMHDGLDRVDVDRMVAELDALADRIDRRSARPWRRRLTTRLRRRARDVARALRHIGTLYAAEPLHAVRIAVKKLRYTLELAERAADVPVSADIAALRQMQDRLGQLHDLQILQTQVQALTAKAATDRRTTRALDAIVQTFETECRERHAEFLRQRDALTALADRVTREAPLWIETAPPKMMRMGVGAGRPNRLRGRLRRSAVAGREAPD